MGLAGGKVDHWNAAMCRRPVSLYSSMENNYPQHLPEMMAFEGFIVLGLLTGYNMAVRFQHLPLEGTKSI